MLLTRSMTVIQGAGRRCRLHPIKAMCVLGMFIAVIGCESTSPTQTVPKGDIEASAVSVGEDMRGLDKLNLSDENLAILERFLKGKRLVASATESARSGQGSVVGILRDQMGGPTIGDLVVWFNQIPDLEDNPYSGTARREVLAARESELPFDQVKFNDVVRDALRRSGVSNHASLEQLNIDAFVEGKDLITEARTLINNALLEFGYAGLWLTLQNPWTSLGLEINGTTIGNLEPKPTTQYRRFAVLLFGAADQNRIVDLSIETPSDATGAKEVRFHRSVELTRKQTVEVFVAPVVVPALSIGMDAKNNTGTPVVLAGDAVKLSVESPLEAELTDIVWIELAGVSTEQVEREDVLAASGGSSPLFGLIAWAELRDMVVAEKTGWRPGARSGIYGHGGSRHQTDMLAGGSLNERVIGTGPSIIWTPEFESPDTYVVVLARNTQGLWGIAKRHVPVMDLRPGVWGRPRAHIHFHGSLAHEAATLDWSRVNQIAVVAGILANMTFLGVEGDPLQIDVCTTPFSEAHVPAKSIRIDYGDGAQELLEGRAGQMSVSHSYSQPGNYVVSVSAVGIDGLERTMKSQVQISAKPALPSPDTPEREVAPDQRAEESAAPSTAELFSDVTAVWADSVAAALADQLPEVELAHIHSRLQQAVIDLFDEALVERFMARGSTVYERDAVWSEAVTNRGALDPESVFGDAGIGLASGAVDRSVVAYKLIEAGVTLEPVGAGLAVRTARVRAFVRVHDRATGAITFAREMPAELSDLVRDVDINRQWREGWNDQPADWMMAIRRSIDWEAPAQAEEGTGSSGNSAGSNGKADAE